MTMNERVSRVAAVLVFTGFILGFAAQGIGYAEEFLTVKGVVEYASERTLTVKDKWSNATVIHDIVGASVVDMNEVKIPKPGSALHGQNATILYRDGKVVFVKIFPPVPE